MRNATYHIIFILFCCSGCKKASDWLNEPRSKQDVIFSTLKDYQDLLNNTSVFNLTFPTIGLISSDNIFVRDQFIPNLPIVERNSYLWNKDVFEGRISVEYSVAYQAINYANTIINGIAKLERNTANSDMFDFINGQAHFFRAYFYFELASLFCKAYSFESAKVDKGLCLRKQADINEIVSRSSLFETFKFILEDAQIAIALLPEKSPVKTRPSKSAAYLLLSRIYLNMADYENSLKYANLCLLNGSELMDFNLEPNINLPFRFPDFKGDNVEVLFYAQGNLYQTIYPSDNLTYSLVDTILYREYDVNDLRRRYFYREFDSASIKFKGSYTGIASNFSGLGTNEAYLNRAECNVRLGKIDDAVGDLNVLMRSRYLKGKYTDYSSNNQDSVLNKVLLERRKELPFTGNIRWQDLRRLNLDPSLATPIYRKIDNVLRVLEPNDNKYVFPIPQNEINLTGIEQNPR